MTNPSKIEEGGVVYILGKFDGKCMYYDFPKILTYLDAKGKLLFGPRFAIDDIDRLLLFKLCNYMIKDKQNCEKFGINLEKGMLLSGPIGCGKTRIMKLLPYFVPNQRPYEMIPSRNVVFSFNHLGSKAIEDYGNSDFYCFDDLGVEPFGRYYGKDSNVIGELLVSRYELFIEKKVKTHATTNLNVRELKKFYGDRVLSRMRELFNLVSFGEQTGDKRK